MKKLDLIKIVIRYRMSITRKPSDYFTPNDIDNMPDMALWSEPEAMIINTLIHYIHYRKQGYSEFDAIKKIQEIESPVYGLRGHNYPKEFLPYLMYRVKSEYSNVSYVYDDILLTKLIQYIYNYE